MGSALSKAAPGMKRVLGEPMFNQPPPAQFPVGTGSQPRPQPRTNAGAILATRAGGLAKRATLMRRQLAMK